MKKGEGPAKQKLRRKKCPHCGGDLEENAIHPGSAVVLSPDPFASPPCPDNWVGYGKKCYYFSEAGENWNNSQSHCSALGASLAVIDNEQEMV